MRLWLWKLVSTHDNLRPISRSSKHYLQHKWINLPNLAIESHNLPLWNIPRHSDTVHAFTGYIESARCRYQRQGGVNTPHRNRGTYLLIPVPDTCFWHRLADFVHIFCRWFSGKDHARQANHVVPFSKHGDDKGSMPNSSSTTSPVGASLSDLLFSFVLEKYIVCEVCGLRSPSFESSSVLHISPTDTPSMQNLILEGLQQKLQKSCSRCNKNTQHIESSYILQPPKYLLPFVNRFRYLNNNIIKDRCPIPLDATVMLGPLKFNLQATIDHHGPSIDSGHYTASINCCKKTFYCNDYITEFGITDKNSSTAYIVLYKWIDAWFLDSNRRVGVWSLPWRWHILSIPLTTGRGTSAETCGLDDVFPPDDLGSRPETLC